jgi:SAM-dependent methyltransferase
MMSGPARELDDPGRVEELRTLIQEKAGLRSYYLEVYRRYSQCLQRCPPEGIALELGSGGSFVKEVIPEILTSDTLPYAGVDRVIDATKMPFADNSLKGIFMLNVFHHIPDVAAFLQEAARCLKPEGRLLIVDQHPGWIGWPIYRFVHHEPFDAKAANWQFQSTGPLSGANGALAWIVFRRDQDKFKALFPTLQLLKYEPHTPLTYWLSGGLKRWSLVPQWAVDWVRAVDGMLLKVSRELGAFVDIEIVKVNSRQ